MSANAEVIATIRQAMSDWNKATQAQRDEALRLAAMRAAQCRAAHAIDSR